MNRVSFLLFLSILLVTSVLVIACTTTMQKGLYDSWIIDSLHINGRKATFPEGFGANILTLSDTGLAVTPYYNDSIRYLGFSLTKSSDSESMLILFQNNAGIFSGEFIVTKHNTIGYKSIDIANDSVRFFCVSIGNW